MTKIFGQQHAYQMERLNEARRVLPFAWRAFVYSGYKDLKMYSSNICAFHLVKKAGIQSVTELENMLSNEAERRRKASRDALFAYAALEAIFDLSNLVLVETYLTQLGYEQEMKGLKASRRMEQTRFVEGLPDQHSKLIAPLLEETNARPIHRVEFLRLLWQRVQSDPILQQHSQYYFDHSTTDYTHELLKYYLLLDKPRQDDGGARTVNLRQDRIALLAYLRVGVYEMSRRGVEGTSTITYQDLPQHSDENKISMLVYDTLFRDTRRPFIARCEGRNVPNQQMQWTDAQSVLNILHLEYKRLVGVKQTQWLGTSEECKAAGMQDKPTGNDD